MHVTKLMDRGSEYNPAVTQTWRSLCQLLSEFNLFILAIKETDKLMKKHNNNNETTEMQSISGS